ncbi:non-hydrolyzing UDP-N-acetylglucosamine 2-epimerase [Serratia aquatilis]|uniref:UDP-N-acetylglucosamine 2-epimerase (non-hydrolyzing) n=1 Tax=Serratia aquatilis TaxID=1737515 RepID=A0ABV6EFB6_9GAMM
MKKIAVILGTRPEAIKYGLVINGLKEDGRFDVIVISTGQHKEMLDDTLAVFGIKPDYNLAVMQPGQTLAQVTARITDGLAKLLPEIAPDALTVHGDTGTTLAAALSGFHHQIPVIHIEAGLRSGNNNSPFPEEGNRKLVAQIASLHLAPTPGNSANLIREGIQEKNIVITGNTVVDSLLWAVNSQYPSTNKIVDDLKDDPRKIILASVHRREAWAKIPDIARTIREISLRDDVRVVIPMHKNPVVRNALKVELSGLQNVDLIEPLNYLDFCHVMKRADIILSDSSGAEEEGPTLGKPTLILRSLTERPEATYSGSAILVGSSGDLIISHVNQILDNLRSFRSSNVKTDHYGDGLATSRVIGAIANYFGLGPAVQPFFSGCEMSQGNDLAANTV